MANNEQTIVIRRGRKRGGGAHGGSWKIAFADFALAMMAFFLVLWLMESTTELERRAISGYFSDPRSLADEGDGGTPYVLDLGGRPLNLANEGLDSALVREDQEQVAESPMEREQIEYLELVRLREKEVLGGVAEELQEALAGQQQFEWIQDSLLIEEGTDGLTIQLVDQTGQPLFRGGGARLHPLARELLWMVAEVLQPVPNAISVYGHTDDLPLSNGVDGEYSNWELSSDRAQAARRALVEGGLDDGRFAQIVGMGASAPFDEEDPTNPANRRLVILVMTEMADSALQGRLPEAGDPNARDRTVDDFMPAPEVF
ncbi:MAG: flagellar motor protein MotB [Pseudomonadota bacterium]